MVARIKKRGSIYLQCRCAASPLGPEAACDWAGLIYILGFVEAASGKWGSSRLGELTFPRQYVRCIGSEREGETGYAGPPTPRSGREQGREIHGPRSGGWANREIMETPSVHSFTSLITPIALQALAEGPRPTPHVAAHLPAPSLILASRWGRGWMMDNGKRKSLVNRTSCSVM